MDGPGCSVTVDFVTLKEIEEDGARAACDCDRSGDGVGEGGELLGLHELAAQAIEHLELGETEAGDPGFIAYALGHAAGDDGGDEEDDEGDEVLRVGDGEGVERREEEEVVACGRGERGDDGVAETPGGGKE